MIIHHNMGWFSLLCQHSFNEWWLKFPRMAILLHLWMLYRQGVILTSSIDLCGIGGSENLNVWPFTSLANLLIFVHPEGGWRGSVAAIQALAEGREFSYSVDHRHWFSRSCADPMGPNSRSGCLWGVYWVFVGRGWHGNRVEWHFSVAGLPHHDSFGGSVGHCWSGSQRRLDGGCRLLSSSHIPHLNAMSQEQVKAAFNKFKSDLENSDR